MNNKFKSKKSNNLCNFTTFRNCAFAKQLIMLTELEQLKYLADDLKNKTFIVLGSGSNVLFVDDYQGTVIINRLRGIEIFKENNSEALIRVAAGEIWHDLVVFLSNKGLYGLENLALIPGTAGAAPIQNIGAYGVEIASFIYNVKIFDIHNKRFKIINNNDCNFTYRNSNFKKKAWHQRYIITHITLRLSKKFVPVLDYQHLCQPKKPKTAIELLSKIIAIRQKKLPDPSVLANAGSFFKNPIITKTQLQLLQNNYSNMSYFDIDSNHVKISAAWLIEKIGYKGYKSENDAGVYKKHALVLVNHGTAQGHEIYKLACDIMDKVKDKFNITILPEVNIIGISDNKH